MNKQELIEKYKELENSSFDVAVIVVCQLVLKDLEQLDELQPVKVPQFVADWIEECKTFEHFVVSLSFALQPVVWEKNNLSGTCIDWLMNANNQETFALAWIFGYEVEKELKYTVKIPVVNQYLVRVKDENFLGFLSSKLRTHFTRKELEEAGFGWVFDCPGVEVTEVE